MRGKNQLRPKLRSEWRVRYHTEPGLPSSMYSDSISGPVPARSNPLKLVQVQ